MGELDLARRRPRNGVTKPKLTLVISAWVRVCVQEGGGGGGAKYRGQKTCWRARQKKDLEWEGDGEVTKGKDGALVGDHDAVVRARANHDLADFAAGHRFDLVRGDHNPAGREGR